jgi:hypothetical protein
MKIGVDIDGVLIDFYSSFVNFYNKRYNGNLNIEDLTDHNFSKIFNISTEEAYNIVLEFYETKEFEDSLLIDKSKEAIEKLGKDNEIFFITSRPEKIKERTQKKLKEIFPDLNFEVHHAKEYVGDNKYKSEICVNNKIDLMIEDSVENVNKIAKKGIKCFLINRPWNKNHEKFPEVICVDSWEEILEKLKNGN